MPTCTPADDAYLTAAWPGVVLRTGEKWTVNVVGANTMTGLYAVTLQGIPFEYTATVPPDDATSIRNGLLAAMGGQLLAAVMAQGATGLLAQEIVPPPPLKPSGLALTVSGPAANTITATLIPGTGDGNADQRAFWLQQALCWLPPCSAFCGCSGDYTVMHAAIAAHLIFTNMPQNIGSTGAGANDFQTMRLGPASLGKGKSTWGMTGNATDDMLSRTVPGQVYLALRRRYVFPIVCA